MTRSISTRRFRFTRSGQTQTALVAFDGMTLSLSPRLRLRRGEVGTQEARRVGRLPPERRWASLPQRVPGLLFEGGRGGGEAKRPNGAPGASLPGLKSLAGD
jgi:hypothetical protein